MILFLEIHVSGIERILLEEADEADEVERASVVHNRWLRASTCTSNSTRSISQITLIVDDFRLRVRVGRAWSVAQRIFSQKSFVVVRARYAMTESSPTWCWMH